MKHIDMQTRVGGLVSAIVILILVQIAGLPVAALDDARDHQSRPVEITLTKWITGFPLMAGVVGGDAEGSFVGEVLQFQQSADGRIIRLEAVYEVQAGDRSFTALLRGGQNNETGTAILDGVILGGWRTGASVHVKYQVMAACDDAPAGVCFQGTIDIAQPFKD